MRLMVAHEIQQEFEEVQSEEEELQEEGKEMENTLRRKTISKNKTSKTRHKLTLSLALIFFLSNIVERPINQIITTRILFSVEGVDKDKLTDEWIDVVKSKQDIQNHQSRLMLK